MVQGTTSDAGKSALVCGLCRVLYRKGLSVAPFKPQNMALNSAVTAGGEIGRAQALQARACCIEASTDMNPVLIKPNSDTGSQIIVHGKAQMTLEASDYHKKKPSLMPEVLLSWKRLQKKYDYIVVEGAGSPAEINLRKNDIANMGFAEAVDCPVIIIADIDRGGVFAHLVGTLELLSASEKKRVKGFVINKFRGDIALLKPGLDWLEEKTGVSVLGVLPYKHQLHLEAEDGFSGLDNRLGESINTLRVVVPVLPRISNHTDFEPLAIREDVDLHYVRSGETIPPADLLILPGTKSVRADFQWLQSNGWGDYIKKHLRYGGKVIGICGGFQMLGNKILDPEGIESKPGSTKTFALLDMETTLHQEKQLKNVQGRLLLGDQYCEGYEIHAGLSKGPALNKPAIKLGSSFDGAMSTDNAIFGTYLHGLFDQTATSNALLAWAGLERPLEVDYAAIREQGIDDMADLCEAHLNLDKVMALFNPQEENS
jgi:adenosylcobyric acid synthase